MITVMLCDLYTMGLATDCRAASALVPYSHEVVLCPRAARRLRFPPRESGTAAGDQRVYILAMGSGMDQYLANQLTTIGVFEVVTDPQKADAIVTDNDWAKPFETS